MRKMFAKSEGPRDPREIDDDVLDGLPADLGRSAAVKRKAPAPASRPGAKSPASRASRPGPPVAPRAAAAPPPVPQKAVAPAAPDSDPWGELEVELSRRIVEKASPARTSVGTRLMEKAKAPKAIARQEVQDLREISRKLDQKILESGLHMLPPVERNVNAVLGIDVDEADLPRDAEQLLVLSVRLMRAAKNFTLSKKIREALFCYEKAIVLFDKVLDLDPGRDNTREMKAYVERFVKILGKRV